MSFTKEKRENIKKYILEKIAEGSPDLISRTTAAFSITPNTAYRYLRELVNDNILSKNGRNFSLVNQEHLYHFHLSEIPKDSEDLVFQKYVDPHLSNLHDNVRNIWYYCFTEMMNNIIDHSQAESVSIFIVQNYMYTSIVLNDDGVGVFNKIQNHYGFPSLEDAIIELFKGKLTTDTEHHSGEGIFFSSRIMDVFAAISSGKIFSHTEFNEVLEDLNDFPSLKNLSSLQNGTYILMKLSNHTHKTTKEIMDRYSNDDGGFIRTIIPIKNIFPTYPVSRSQAKRLSHRFDSFQEVQLDFEGVSEIGQGFAHELFVVFHGLHPEIELIPFNVNSEIQKMINHVTK